MIAAYVFVTIKRLKYDQFLDIEYNAFLDINIFGTTTLTVIYLFKWTVLRLIKPDFAMVELLKAFMAARTCNGPLRTIRRQETQCVVVH